MARPKNVLVPSTGNAKAVKPKAKSAEKPAETPVAAQEAPQAPEKPKQYVKVYEVTLDGITKPDGTGEWSGQVTEAELRAGGAAFDWLLGTGRIKEVGMKEVQ